MQSKQLVLCCQLQGLSIEFLVVEALLPYDVCVVCVCVASVWYVALAYHLGGCWEMVVLEHGWECSIGWAGTHLYYVHISCGSM